MSMQYIVPLNLNRKPRKHVFFWARAAWHIALVCTAGKHYHKSNMADNQDDGEIIGLHSPAARQSCNQHEGNAW